MVTLWLRKYSFSLHHTILITKAPSFFISLGTKFWLINRAAYYAFYLLFGHNNLAWALSSKFLFSSRRGYFFLCVCARGGPIVEPQYSGHLICRVWVNLIVLRSFRIIMIIIYVQFSLVRLGFVLNFFFFY